MRLRGQLGSSGTVALALRAVTGSAAVLKDGFARFSRSGITGKGVALAGVFGGDFKMVVIPIVVVSIGVAGVFVFIGIGMSRCAGFVLAERG